MPDSLSQALSFLLSILRLWLSARRSLYHLTAVRALLVALTEAPKPVVAPMQAAVVQAALVALVASVVAALVASVVAAAQVMFVRLQPARAVSGNASTCSPPVWHFVFFAGYGNSIGFSTRLLTCGVFAQPRFDNLTVAALEIFLHEHLQNFS